MLEPDEAFSTIDSTNPHFVILDVDYDHLLNQRIKLGKLILAQHPHLKVTLLTFGYNLAFAGKAKRAGFHGYMSKEPDPNEVMRGVRAILTGHYYFKFLKPGHYPEVLTGDEFTRRLTLNLRQIEIISMMRRGSSIKEMMCHFLDKPQTIHAHKQVIYRKLGINKEADIIQFAIR